MKCTVIKKLLLLGGIISASNAMEYKQPHYTQKQHRSWPDLRHETAKAVQEDLEKQNLQIREMKQYNNQTRLLFITMQRLLKIAFDKIEKLEKEKKHFMNEENSLGSISPHVPKKNGNESCHSGNDFEAYLKRNLLRMPNEIEDEEDSVADSAGSALFFNSKYKTVDVTILSNNDKTVIDLSKESCED